ncbi:MAG TPA: Mur ligase family protein, partial [Bacteroidota bacterium]|nr:Mur ligase family protein [Bacteroidota bacterium]
MKITMEELLSIPHTGQRNLEGLRQAVFAGVSINSRTVNRGEIFIAIRGEKLDGHEFVAEAIAHGAVIAIVDSKSNVGENIPQIIVGDTATALGDLARLHRKRFGIPVIAVAGSNGKTTTKEMIAGVLATQYRVLKTEGNLNNHIGVPLTMFRLDETHQAAVVEIGANHFGELAALCSYLEPTHGLLTNVGREHLEFFGDANGAAKAEGEVFGYLKSSGLGFVNIDDDLVVDQAKQITNKITYGFRTGSDIRGEFESMDARGCVKFSA